MPTTKASRKTRSNKPRKPYPDFPLFPHATGRWAKKIRGQIHYFGPWDDPIAALQKYQEQRDDLHAGRTPRVAADGLTLRDMVNRFLTAKKHQLDTGEITARTFTDYHATCKRLIDTFGVSRLVVDLASDDFERLRAELAKARGPVALGNEVQRVRVVFKYAYDAGLIDRPMRYGPTFKRPSKKVLRAARHAKGPRMFEAAEIRRLLDAAGMQLKAMILLGINCGFGNNDVATLPIRALDLITGWVDHPRPKTAVQRRAPLWPETVAALKEAIENRPKPRDATHESLVFITKYGQPWTNHMLKPRDGAAPELGTAAVVSPPPLASTDSPITKELAKLLKSLDIERPGVNFYALRHTFETIGGESRDQVAVDAVMGHSRDDMASVYRERISDERLVAVSNLVRRWLFGDTREAPAKEAKQAKKVSNES
jgi:integrase